jgi:hypothetical protein
MGAVQQACVVRLGNAIAPVLAVPVVDVRAVDRPGPPGGAGHGTDQRGQQDVLAALSGLRTSALAVTRARSPAVEDLFRRLTPGGEMMNKY